MFRAYAARKTVGLARAAAVAAARAHAAELSEAHLERMQDEAADVKGIYNDFFAKGPGRKRKRRQAIRQAKARAAKFFRPFEKKKELRAALLVQTRWRGKLARTKVADMKFAINDAAARKIQGLWRRGTSLWSKVRQAIHDLRCAAGAVQCQRRVRGNKARRIVARLRAALTLQRAWRGNIARRALLMARRHRPVEPAAAAEHT